MQHNLFSIAGNIKLRWSSLTLAALVTFILLSNSHNAQLQSSAQAKTNFPEPVLELTADTTAEYLTNKKAFQEMISIDEANYMDAEPEKTVANTASNQLQDMQLWTVRSGDTFSGILHSVGAYSSFGSILALGKEVKPLFNLQAGKQLYIKIKDAELDELIYKHRSKENFFLYKKDERYVAENRALPIENREAFITAVIEDSFYLSAQKAGMSDEIIIETANILAWDIDFILDTRKGDKFSVLYMEEYLHGEKIGNGDIIGIKFTNRGKVHHAIRHTLANGRSEYFSLDGKNIKKPFLRSPLKFTRVSSSFNPKRLHPILNKVRPHRGVDYAAPTGTPIYASGDGKVIYRGWKAGYGNTLIIRHGNVYSTLYAHLSKFVKNVKHATSVKQGQTIGYVGKTGYATGPHLHYEFRINGVHKNPLTVKLPDSKPLPNRQLKDFTQATNLVVKKLEILSSAYTNSSSGL